MAGAAWCGGNGGLEPEAAGLFGDHGEAELGPLMGDGAGGLLDKPATLKGRLLCAGNPERGPWGMPLTPVLMVGLGRYTPAVLADR